MKPDFFNIFLFYKNCRIQWNLKKIAVLLNNYKFNGFKKKKMILLNKKT
jgi:hypothetical protein